MATSLCLEVKKKKKKKKDKGDLLRIGTWNVQTLGQTDHIVSSAYTFITLDFLLFIQYESVIH